MGFSKHVRILCKHSKSFSQISEIVSVIYLKFFGGVEKRTCYHIELFSLFSGSVQQIKKAIVKLKEDISQLNLEVALLVHAYDQDTVRQTLGTTDQANSN